MKKDLTFCIEFVEYNACLLSTPGVGVLELYCSFFPTPVAQILPLPLSLVKTVTYPTGFSNKKNLDFWSCVIQVVAKYIGKEIEAMLRVWLAIHFFDLLVEPFLWIIDALTAADIECSTIETSRDPPKIFIPIPKIESNGCARSDSLICSLIF
ncbi:hypothetical protein QUB49_35445 [Microcoleus sp. AT9_B4]